MINAFALFSLYLVKTIFIEYKENKMKNLYIDTETTGIHPKKNGLIQLSGIIEIEGKIAENFNFFVKPFPKDEINEEALQVSGTTHKDLKKYASPKNIFKKFTTLLEKYIDPYNKEDKFFFVAYNANFDKSFIVNFFIKNDNHYFSSYFFFPPIDVMYLAAEHLKNRRATMENFKLATVAKTLEIRLDTSKLHDAMYDIELTKMIYDKIRVIEDNISHNKFKETLF